VVKKQTGRRSGRGSPKLTLRLFEETREILQGALA
jgi:hypothetical protein